jgi:hypothetical protein
VCVCGGEGRGGGEGGQRSGGEGGGSVPCILSASCQENVTNVITFFLRNLVVKQPYLQGKSCYLTPIINFGPDFLHHFSIPVLFPLPDYVHYAIVSTGQSFLFSRFIVIRLLYV